MSKPVKRVAAVSDVGESNFNRLPDELLLQIFKNLVDFKALCFSSLVCKRFASIIPHVDHICLAIPQSKSNTPKIPVGRPISSSLGASFVGASLFLTKFDDIRRLDIEIPYDYGANLIFKWKGVFGRRMESFAFFSATSVHRKQQNMNNKEEEETEPSKKEVIRLWYSCMQDSMMRYEALLMFVHKYPLLDRLTITDPNKHGMICLSKEELIEIRDLSCSFPKSDEAFRKPVKLWYMTEMELGSRYVLKGVKLAIMGKGGGYNDGNSDNGNVIPRGLVVGNIFREAEKQSMLNPRNCLWYLE